MKPRRKKEIGNEVWMMKRKMEVGKGEEVTRMETKAWRIK